MVQTVLAVPDSAEKLLQFIAECGGDATCAVLQVGRVLVNVHDKFQELIVMMRSGVETFIVYDEGLCDEDDRLHEFSAIDETYEVLWWRRRGWRRCAALSDRQLVARTLWTHFTFREPVSQSNNA